MNIIRVSFDLALGYDNPPCFTFTLTFVFFVFFFSSFPLVLISLTLTELDDQEFLLHFAINYQLLAMHIV